MSALERPFVAETLALLRQAWADFARHHAQWLAAALAYFAAFAVAPLIVVFVEIAGFIVHSHRHVLNLIFRYIDRDAGPGAHALRELVASTFGQARNGVLAQIVGWGIFVVAALALFSATQFALNTVWGTLPEKTTLLRSIRQRAWSFVVMLLIALLLLVSMGINAALTAITAYLVSLSPAFVALMKGVDFVASFAVIWIGFAVLFICLPDARPSWRDVRLGAAITAFLFVVGQFLLGWYLGTASLSSAYGAFGSLVAFLIWVNYSSQILLFGAELTHAYAERLGSRRAHG